MFFAPETGIGVIQVMNRDTSEGTSAPDIYATLDLLFDRAELAIAE